ncbi:MAG: hypothetical protein K2I44_10340 [Muribaculaceae bacterium]|nr:hypothetical protein [Muribaculaceae bacterium]
MKKDRNHTTDTSSPSPCKSENEILLNLPPIDQDKIRQLSKLSKEDIRALIAPLRKVLSKKNVTFSGNSDPWLMQTVSMLNDSTTWHNLLKDQLSKIYISFISDIDNILNVISTEPKLEKAWRLILFSPEVKNDIVTGSLGREIVVKSSWHWNATQYMECLFFPLLILEDERNYYSYYSSNKKNYSFSIYPDFRKKMLEKLYGKETTAIELFKEIPADEDLEISNFEKEIPSELSILTGIGMTGNPLSSNTGALTAAKLKSIKKNYSLKEFSPRPDDLHVDRTEMMVTAFFLQGGKQISASDTGKFARFVAKKMPGMLKPANFGMLLPGFSGFTKSWAESHNAGVMADIAETLISPSADGWMSLANLRIRFLCSDINKWDNTVYCHLFTERGRERHTLKRENEVRESYVNYSRNINWINEIDFPFILNWIKLLCAVGILEIAEEITPAETSDYLEGMRYVRLTPLGRYAVGIDNKYEAPVNSSSCEFDFDEKNGIITILSESCPYVMFLKQISIPIGSSRFRITPQSILQGCASHSDLDDRIDKLKKLVDVDSSKFLRSIIKEASQRVGCIRGVDEEYYLFKLKAGVPGFVEFLSSDDEIRENSLFVQDGMILVKKAFFSKFMAICRHQGYILS